MKNKNFNKIACKFLLLLIIAVNMPLKLFAYAIGKYSNHISEYVIDEDNGLIYQVLVDEIGVPLELGVIGTIDNNQMNLNIPSEIYYLRPFHDHIKDPQPYDFRHGGVYSITEISISHRFVDDPNDRYKVYPWSIRSINIPHTVTYIKEGVFKPYYGYKGYPEDKFNNDSVPKLKEINVDSGNPNFTSVDGVLYNKDKTILIACPPAKTECNIPSTVTEIANYAFAGCRNLKSLTIPESVTSIGDYVFSGCKSLKSLNITEAVTSIGDYAFSGCTGLKSLVIPVAQIGAHVFDGCTNLEAITLPEPVTSIGDYAFKDCESLVSIDFPASLISIGDDIFNGCGQLKEIRVAPGNGRFADVDGVLYDKDLYELRFCPNALTECLIPPSVVIIGDNAFSGCASLASVNIPPSVQMIKSKAFMNCSSLSEITLPASVEYIGEKTFSGCSSLLTINAMRMRPAETGNRAFEGVPIDAYVYVPKRTIPFYLASKPWSVFYYYFEVEEWVTGISNVTADTLQDVHTLQGIGVKRNATEADIDALPQGLYIIGGKKVYVK